MPFLADTIQQQRPQFRKTFTEGCYPQYTNKFEDMSL